MLISIQTLFPKKPPQYRKHAYNVLLATAKELDCLLTQYYFEPLSDDGKIFLYSEYFDKECEEVLQKHGFVEHTNFDKEVWHINYRAQENKENKRVFTFDDDANKIHIKVLNFE